MNVSPAYLRTLSNRRGVVLLVVLVLLALFSVVAVTFVFFSNTESRSARIHLDAQSQLHPDVDPEVLLSYFMGQLLYDAPDDERGVYSGLRGHSLARTMFGGAYVIAPDGTAVYAGNDVPYNGAGRLHTGPGSYHNPFGVDDHRLINYTYHSADGFVRDPERLNPVGPRPGKPAWRTDLSDARGSFFGGFNAPYTYPDLNNVFLAAVKADGTVLMPSFHRHWLFRDPTLPPTMTSLHPSNPHWTSAAGKYLLIRPRPIDQLLPGQTVSAFPYPEDGGGDVKNWIGSPGYYDPITRKFYSNDSVWIDLDFPVVRAPDGRKFKPLFAPLIMDLDGRVNLNVHGNIRGVEIDLNTGQPLIDPATGRALRRHASNQGWGPWEVSLARVLNKNRPGGWPEWPAVFHGNADTPARYGRDIFPHSILTGPPPPVGPLPHWYAPVDLDGCQELLLAQASEQPRLPGTSPSLPYQCFPASPAGYGNASVLERINHPMVYNPFSPFAPDRAFSLANMEAILRFGDTGIPALSPPVFRLCPQNFADRRVRGMVTTRSFDVDRPGVTPWFWTDDRVSPAYQRQPPLQPVTNAPPQPAAGAVPFPPLTATMIESEFGADGRAARALTAVRRLDLNRYLPDYPLPPANGPITDPQGLEGFAVAQKAREYMVAEILELLLRVTGAGNPLQAPVPGDAGHEPERWRAFRWYAQFAVNIVDYIDSDDHMTPFNWDTRPSPGKPAGEWVYGAELPRLVVNEAYVEYANEPNDPGLSAAPPKATKLKANVWVELYNTSRDDNPVTAPYRSGTVRLQTNAYPIYQVLIARLAGDIRLPENDRGDVIPGTGGILQRVISFNPDSLAPANLANLGGYLGPDGGNQGFYVLGPALNGTSERNPFGGGAGRAFETAQRPEMSYVVDAFPDPGAAPKPSILLQRLACPHLPPNPSLAGVLDPNLPLNPYVTVDYMHDVVANYAAEVGADGPMMPPPTAAEDRLSFGRPQPFAAHKSLMKPQRPKVAPGNGPLPNQPQHSFFQHNVDVTTPGPNWRTPWPADLGPRFDWLVHLDRHLVSPLELSQVSAYKPFELTQEFIAQAGLLQKAHNHRVNWFDEGLTDLNNPQSFRLYRFFEFLSTRGLALGPVPIVTQSRLPFTAISSGLSREVFPEQMSGVTATGGTWSIESGSTLIIDCGKTSEEVVRVLAPSTPNSFFANFLKDHNEPITITPVTVSERVPGKINLNTVWDEEVFLALCDPQFSNSFSNEGIAKDMFQKLRQSRTVGYAQGNESPSEGDRPFLSLATGWTPPDDAPLTSRGIQDTILRPSTLGADPFLTVPAMPHPYQGHELMTKIFNHATTRSNVFAVWITVGFFEVTDDRSRPVKLGAEIGRNEGRHVRHRLFAIVDRSLLLQNPGPQAHFHLHGPSPGAAGTPLVQYFSIIQ